MSIGSPASVVKPPRDASGAGAPQVGARMPLAVDMDGSLLRVDTLYETFAAALFTSPLATLAAFSRLARGIAPFKRRLSEIAQIDVETLPLREDLVEWLRTE